MKCNFIFHIGNEVLFDRIFDVVPSTRTTLHFNFCILRANEAIGAKISQRKQTNTRIINNITIFESNWLTFGPNERWSLKLLEIRDYLDINFHWALYYLHLGITYGSVAVLNSYLINETSNLSYLHFFWHVIRSIFNG